jgi:hypothetical protein
MPIRRWGAVGRGLEVADEVGAVVGEAVTVAVGTGSAVVVVGAGAAAVTVCVGPETVAVVVVVAVTVCVDVTVAVAVTVRQAEATFVPAHGFLFRTDPAVALLGAKRPPATAMNMATTAMTAVRAVRPARRLGLRGERCRVTDERWREAGKR